MSDETGTSKPASRRKTKQVKPMSYAEAHRLMKLTKDFITVCNQGATDKAEKVAEEISDFVTERFV